MSGLDINALTKIGELLEAHPELEETLVSLSPAFAKLRNPILRRTVARIATLEQAARMAGISPPDLVARLRAALGDAAPPTGGPSEARSPAAADAPPDWLDLSRVTATIDADELLERGEHPLGLVGRVGGELPPGDLICVTSSFRPVPLVESLAPRGLEGFTIDKGAGRFATYFRKI